MLNWRVACWPPSSVTRSVKEKVPAVVGVPVMRPGDVVKDNPGGSCPAQRSANGIRASVTLAPYEHRRDR
jgi:hypothetical protein